jgi:hypothetical protein
MHGTRTPVNIILDRNLNPRISDFGADWYYLGPECEKERDKQRRQCNFRHFLMVLSLKQWTIDITSS